MVTEISSLHCNQNTNNKYWHTTAHRPTTIDHYTDLLCYKLGEGRGRIDSNLKTWGKHVLIMCEVIYSSNNNIVYLMMMMVSNNIDNDNDSIDSTNYTCNINIEMMIMMMVLINI